MPDASEALPPVAILAGGLATRLRPLTASVPKSLVIVAGQPFIAHQLRHLARQGVRAAVICAGHLGPQIEEFVGDGARFGCAIRYSWDGPTPLGTGGALRAALPLLGEHFLVLYGDSYPPIPIPPVWLAFRAAGLPALMTVFGNADRFEASNVAFSAGRVRRYDKRRRHADMRHIDYGLGVFAAAAFAGTPAGRAWDLADLQRDLAERGQLAGHEVAQRFYEIGSPAGLADTDAFLRETAAAKDRAAAGG